MAALRAASSNAGADASTTIAPPQPDCLTILTAAFQASRHLVKDVPHGLFY
jgi:hypothetical protein